PVVVEVDGNDARSTVQAGGHDHGHANRPDTNDGNDVTRRHPAVAHADLKAGGQDVGEHETGLIADTFGKLVQRVVRKRYPDVLRLGAVDQVTQDPSDTTVSLLIETVGGQPLVAV